jgi:uncharacterized membrane protein
MLTATAQPQRAPRAHPKERTVSDDLTPTPAPQPAATGLDPKVGGLLAYLLFGWIGGLIMYLTQSHREVRFHGAQSVLLSIVLFAVYIALAVLGGVFAFVPGVGTLFAVVTFLANTVIGLGSFVLWIILCIKGYNLEHFKLPIIGEHAERWAAK